MSKWTKLIDYFDISRFFNNQSMPEIIKTTPCIFWNNPSVWCNCSNIWSIEISTNVKRPFLGSIYKDLKTWTEEKNTLLEDYLEEECDGRKQESIVKEHNPISLGYEKYILTQQKINESDIISLIVFTEGIGYYKNVTEKEAKELITRGKPKFFTKIPDITSESNRKFFSKTIYDSIINGGQRRNKVEGFIFNIIYLYFQFTEEVQDIELIKIIKDSFVQHFGKNKKKELLVPTSYFKLIKECILNAKKNRHRN